MSLIKKRLSVLLSAVVCGSLLFSATGAAAAGPPVGVQTQPSIVNAEPSRVAKTITGGSLASGVAGHQTTKLASAQIRVAKPAFAPVIGWILIQLGRMGIQFVIKHFGKTAVKKAIRAQVLSLNAKKWTHILAPKHNWHKLGAANNKSKVSDFIARAMADGKHSSYKGSPDVNIASWVHQGKKIEVTYHKASGKVSNAWVK